MPTCITTYNGPEVHQTNDACNIQFEQKLGKRVNQKMGADSVSPSFSYLLVSLHILSTIVTLDLYMVFSIIH